MSSDVLDQWVSGNKFGPATIVSRRDFRHLGMSVVEIVAEWNDGKRKLLWVRAPITTSQVVRPTPDEASGAYQLQKIRNPIVHADYPSDGDEEAARKAVRQRFEEHWNLLTV